MSSMSTPGSSSSTPHRYQTAQAQDPRVPVAHSYYQTASTSRASDYAYAQQQQQFAAAHQAQGISSASTSTNSTPYSYVPPQVQRQPRRPSPLADRAHSIEELAKIANLDKYNRYGDVKQDLRRAEAYMLEGKKDLEAKDFEWAFVNFARTATLVLNHIPTNSHYEDMKPAHRATLADNGNFCLEKMGELKPRLVDKFEVWQHRNPGVSTELDMDLIKSTMAARDEEGLAIRAQMSKEKRAASKEEAARRVQAEEEKRRNEEAAVRRAEQQQPDYDEEYRRRHDAVRQKQAREMAERKAQEDAKRRHEEVRRREAEESLRMRMASEPSAAEIERRRREAAIEEVTRRGAEYKRRQEEERRQEQARQEQEAASRRKSEELEYRRQMEEKRRREQEGIAQRQREAEAEAEASRNLLRVSMPVAAPSLPPSSSSESSRSSSTTQTLTPRQQDALPILPLESPTREEGFDPRNGRHHPQPQHAISDRAIGRTDQYKAPITTTSPAPKGQPVAIQYPELMTVHQRQQGYAPSLQSMFSPPISGPPTGLLFSPNHPEGPSMRNMPSSPERPPAHIRHMWEQAGYGFQYSQPISKPKPPPAPGDSRILRPEQVRDEAATIIGKELRIVKVPQDILPRFLAVAAVNTARNRETCALLMGRAHGKEYRISTLLIPKQHATSDSCTMDEEELLSEFAETRKLLILGWIHTHPTQSCFMSSLDLHTHAGFQCSLPEFFAIVCAPKHTPNCGIFRLTDPPGLKIILKCENKASFHPHPENPIYTDADKGHVVWVDDMALEIVDLR